jgi:hypothetical protein
MAASAEASDEMADGISGMKKGRNVVAVEP